MSNGLSSFIKGIFSRDTFLPPTTITSRGNRLLFAIWLFILFTVLSGSVRKWVTGPGVFGNIIFLTQLLLPFIFLQITHKNKSNPNYRVPGLFLFFVIYMVLTALNPKNNTIYHGIFGLVIHLGFWICWVAYYRTKPIFEIEKFTNLMIAILIGEVILASAQNALPGTHFLNRFATGEENNTIVGKAVRVAGTFSYLGGFQAWVTFNGFFIWALLIRRLPAIIILIVFSLSLFVGFLSGARGAVGLLIIISIFGSIYTGFFLKNFFSIILHFSLLAIFVFFLGGSFSNKFSTAYSNFLTRLTSRGDNNAELGGRVIDSFTEVLKFKGDYPVYGIGLGSTYQGANVLFGESTYVKEYGYYESEMGRIVLEGGFILLVLRIVLFVILIRVSSIPPLGQFFIFFIFLNSMIVFNTYLSAFFFLGFVFVDRAYYLEQIIE